MGDHWKAEQVSNEQAKCDGWAVTYDPTPGGKENPDGSTSFGLIMPVLFVMDGIKNPEVFASHIAEKLNAAGA